MGSRGFAVSGREDISKFVVHLTRNDTNTFGESGGSAKENFRAILEERQISAYLPHCLFAKDIPDRYQERFSVCCFSEIPLTQIHLLTQRIPGRNNQFEEYGFVFSREFIISKGAQPAIYINSYNDNTWLREAVDSLFNVAKKGGFHKGKIWRLLPFINAMHERYDFTWEREWRVRGDLKFRMYDLACVILPKSGELSLKQKFARSAIPVIHPGLTYEEIVYEFSTQQRKTKNIWGKKKKRAKLKKLKMPRK